MDMIQDWMIINKIKMGDPDAWDILVHKYYDTNFLAERLFSFISFRLLSIDNPYRKPF